MKKTASLPFCCLFTLLSLVIFACGLTGSQNVTQPAESSPVATASVASIRPSATPPASMMQTIEPVFTLTPAPEPTPLVISDSDLPVHAGTALPQGAAPLNLENAGQLRLLGLWGLGSPQGLVWSLDSNRIVVGYQAGVLVFDRETGNELYRIRTAGWLAGMDLSPDGSTLALAHTDGLLEFYNFSDGKLVYSQPDLLAEKPSSLRYLPDGEFLLAGLYVGMLNIISAQAMEVPVYSIFGDYGYPVDNLAILPGGPGVVGTGNSQGLSVWNLADLENPQLLYYLPGSEGLSGEIHIAASPDGRWVAASSWDGALLWDLSGESAPQGYKMLWGELEGFDPLTTWNSLAFSADSQVLATGGSDGAIWLWDVLEAVPLKAVQAGSAPVEYLSFSPDGQTLATMLEDGQAVLLQSDFRDHSDYLELKQTLQTSAAWFGSLAALSGDGQFLATATQAFLGDGSWNTLIDPTGLYLRSAADGHVIRSMDMQDYEVSPGGFVGLALSPDGRWLAASPLGLPLGVWDTSTGALVYFLNDPPGDDQSCDRALFSPANNVLAAYCHDGRVHLWQYDSGAYWRSLQGDYLAVSALAFSTGGIVLATANAEGQVSLWNPWDGSLVRTLQVVEPAPITHLAFSPNGRYLACTTGRDYPKVVVWDIASGEQLAWLGFNDTVSSAVFSPDGTLLAVAVNFEFVDKLEIWDWQGQNLLAAQDYHAQINQLFLSSDGRFVITISLDGLVRIWGVDS